MSRRANSAPSRKAGPARLPGPRRATGPLVVVVIAVAVATLFVALKSRQPSDDVRGENDGAPSDAAVAGLGAEEAYRQALDLARRERLEESLPYFRRALAAQGEDFWEIHFDYASALYNLTRAYRARRGLQVPVLRSSHEQVEVMVESLDHLERAERLAPTPAVRAQIEDRRAQMMAVWGFPWETLLAYRRAAELDPAQPRYAELARQYAELMRAPHEAKKP